MAEKEYDEELEGDDEELENEELENEDTDSYTTNTQSAITSKMSAISAALHRQAAGGVRGVDDFDEGSMEDMYDIPSNLPKTWLIDGKQRPCIVVRMRPERWYTHPLHKQLLPVTKELFTGPGKPMSPGQFDSEGFLRAGDIITFLCPTEVYVKYKKSTRSIAQQRNEQMSQPSGNPEQGGLVMKGAQHQRIQEG